MRSGRDGELSWAVFYLSTCNSLDSVGHSVTALWPHASKTKLLEVYATSEYGNGYHSLPDP